MKNAKSCCLILGAFFENFEGKEENRRLKEKISNQIDQFIEKEQISHFFTGMEEGVDLFYADYVLSKKKENNLSLTCVIAYEEQASFYSESERDLYFSVAQRSDKEIMLNTKRTFGCKEKRNEFMIKNSDVVLFVCPALDTEEIVKHKDLLLNKQIIVIDPFNSNQNTSFKCIE